MYEIVKNLIPDLPQTPYDGGVGAYVGVIGHATAMDDDTPLGERQFESTTWKNAFVHVFVDHDQILQIANENYICYGAGRTGNHKGYVQVELCQTHDHSLFLQSFDRYCYILAYFLHKNKLEVIDDVTLRSHKEISDAYGESDHQDPIEYLAEHGKTWSDVVSGVIAWNNTFKLGDILMDWKKVIETVASEPAAWEKAINTAVAAAKADGSLGDLETFQWLPDLIMKIWNFKKV